MFSEDDFDDIPSQYILIICLKKVNPLLDKEPFTEIRIETVISVKDSLQIDEAIDIFEKSVADEQKKKQLRKLLTDYRDKDIFCDDLISKRFKKFTYLDKFSYIITIHKSLTNEA